MTLKLPTVNHLGRRPLPPTAVIVRKGRSNLLVNVVIQKRHKLLREAEQAADSD